MATLSKIQIGDTVITLPSGGGDASSITLSDLVERSTKYSEIPIEMELDDDTVVSAHVIGYAQGPEI